MRYHAVVDLTHFEAAPRLLALYLKLAPQALPGHVLPSLYPTLLPI